MRLVGGAALAVCAPAALAADEAPTRMDPITVTATRLPASSFDVPAAISTVFSSTSLSEDGIGVNLSEVLSLVPGLVARDRQNYAQDTQISIRGFGARSTFGIRGVRLYLDGIPATQPDGQGQVSHFNLASADRVEILRGPFSALYGNSSGGVIQMFTADPPTTPQVSFGAVAGSFDTYRANAGMRGSVGTVGYAFDYTYFDTEGFRDHSAARRDSITGKLSIALGQDSRLTLLLNHFAMPEALDPLGLTRAQFDDDPSQATPQAETFNTRKSVDQSQGGAVYEWGLGPGHGVRVLGYYGRREIRQFLSIPVAVQTPATHSGGVVDLGNDYAGTDARWSWRGELAHRSFSVVAGLSYETLAQDRRGYNNFVDEQTGVQGELRRDETNDVDSFDQYLQADWRFAERWSLLLGLRNNRIRFKSDDRYVTGTEPGDNRDDSGEVDYSALTPVGGLMFRYRPDLHMYATYGRGFETPTLVELAYRPDGESGPNLDLDPARSNTGEIGAKLRWRASTDAQIALFHANTRDEIVICANSGGRSAYCNAGRVRRQGAEATINTRFGERWSLQLAQTWLDATVRESYLSCTSAPCFAPDTPVTIGNRLPGVPGWKTDLALRWGTLTGWHAELDTQYLDKVYVNDVNDEAAPSYALLSIRGGYVFDLPRLRLRLFASVDNLFDTDYVGSVIVNDGNRRFYEPGPDRSVFAGLGVDWTY